MKKVAITVNGKVANWVFVEAAKRSTSASRLHGEILAEKMRRGEVQERGVR